MDQNRKKAKEKERSKIEEQVGTDTKQNIYGYMQCCNLSLSLSVSRRFLLSHLLSACNIEVPDEFTNNSFLYNPLHIETKLNWFLKKVTLISLLY